MILECPYCEHEFDLENWGENLDADSWIEDVECPGRKLLMDGKRVQKIKETIRK